MSPARALGSVCIPSRMLFVRWTKLCISFAIDVFEAGPWQFFKDLEDPELRRLAETLPETMLQCRATSTTRKYLGAFRRWRQWARTHQLNPFPVKEHHLVLYLQHLAETTGSKAMVEETVYSMTWVHNLASVPSPTENSLVTSTLEGLRRALAKPVSKKEPITVDILKAMVADTNKRPTLSNVRLTAACLLAFSGFLRFNELVNIRPCDLTMHEKMIKLQIPQSKTDQLRKGKEVVIAASGQDTCPVDWLKRYMQMGRIQKDSTLFLFRQVTKMKRGEYLRDYGAISYTTLREQFKAKMKYLGYQADKFGIHSLRAGGASAAANADVPDRLFKRHGRWRSENAKDGYIEDSLEKRLSITKHLGL